MNNYFKSENNKNVINIGTNNAPIYISDKEFGTNTEQIDNKEVPTVLGDEKLLSSERPSIYQPLITLILIAFVGILTFTLFRPSTEIIPKDKLAESATNIQSNIALKSTENVNLTKSVSSPEIRTTIDSDTVKPKQNTLPKRSEKKSVLKNVAASEKTLGTLNRDNKNYTPSLCSSYTKGCPSK